MRHIKTIIIILIVVGCNSLQRESHKDSIREIYKYHKAEEKFTLIGKYNPSLQKTDALNPLIDFQLDSINNKIVYKNTTLFQFDSINFSYNGEIHIFSMFHYDILNEYDEECIILTKKNKPYLIYNYPWGGYLFIVSDSTEKILMKEIIKDRRLLKKVLI